MDAVDHPDKYEPGVLELARELIERPRELTDQERELMNRAVLDFVRAPQQKTTKQPPKPVVKKTETIPDELFPDLDTKIEDERPLSAADENEPPPFWWL